MIWNLFQELGNTLGRLRRTPVLTAALNIVWEILGGRALFRDRPFFAIVDGRHKKMKRPLPSYISEGWASNDPREGVINLKCGAWVCLAIMTCLRTMPGARHDPIIGEYLYRLNFGVHILIRNSAPRGYWEMTVHFDNDIAIEREERGFDERIQAMFFQGSHRHETAHKRIALRTVFLRARKSEVFVLDV